MAEPSFALAERRSLLVPIALAVVALALAVSVAIHFFPATSIKTVHIRAQAVPMQVKLASDSNVVSAQREVDSALFVAETMRIDNAMRQPIFLDDFELSLTDAHGAMLTEGAVKTADLPALEANFPALRPLMQKPLLREMTIQPGESVEGTVLFSLPVPAEVWTSRKGATVKTSLYHLNPDYLTIPN